MQDSPPAHGVCPCGSAALRPCSSPTLPFFVFVFIDFVAHSSSSSLSSSSSTFTLHPPVACRWRLVARPPAQAGVRGRGFEAASPRHARRGYPLGPWLLDRGDQSSFVAPFCVRPSRGCPPRQCRVRLTLRFEGRCCQHCRERHPAGRALIASVCPSIPKNECRAPKPSDPPVIGHR
jgi:hypothetical protein